MTAVKAYAATNATEPLAPLDINRRETGTHDVKIKILFCGVCHSDLHQVRNEWGNSIYPMVPGHEIVGEVIEVGEHVTKFKTGDLAGIGCFVDSCRSCESCKKGLEQYCENGMVGTYNGLDKEGKPTYGGYSTEIVVDEAYTLTIDRKLDLARVAPLLCAGITTFSPIMEWKMGKGHKIGVLGLGGLGHMAVKFAVSLGAEVTMLSSSPSKEKDAKNLGAHNFALTSDKEAMSKYNNYFNFIIDTVSAPHDVSFYLQLLDLDGTMVMLGVPPEAPQIHAFNFIMRRRRLAGSLIGGIKETQEMLDYCAEHNIMSDIELIPISQINEAYTRMLKSDVKYRFVIDMASL